MTEQDFAEALRLLLQGDEVSEVFDLDLANQWVDVATFDERGVLTNNEGLVVKLPDGSEFQITIVQSREARRAMPANGR